jgi:hypothetical protein
MGVNESRRCNASAKLDLMQTAVRRQISDARYSIALNRDISLVVRADRILTTRAD